MTFGEMQKWTQRFNNVVEVGGTSKNQRLENLKTDLQICYEDNPNKFATGLYNRACEEMEA